MVVVRDATLADLDLLVRIDLEDEGVTPGTPITSNEEQTEAHRRLIRGFVIDHGAHIAEVHGAPVGAILWRPRSLDTVEDGSVFRQLDVAVFPSNGMFAEIFQLWVDRAHRRRGIATALKRAVEAAAWSRAISMIYTHTEQRNLHVLALNQKLGYREVRRGPIWDDVIRVSLVKHLR
jgi:ribosomal protein S18 acetylase RimI-like enzyme